MYDWPEAQADNAAFWQAVRRRLYTRLERQAKAGLPHTLPANLPDKLETLTAITLDAHWQQPDLLLSQSCWGPLKAGYLAYLEPVAQPCYSQFEGGREMMYRSALIARTGTTAPVPDHSHATGLDGLLQDKRFGYNHDASLSGLLSLAEDLQTEASLLQKDGIKTGSHRASVIMIAEGKIDIAAIDCRSWAMAKRYEPAAQFCTVIGWTSENVGLPYVTSRHTEPHIKDALTAALKDHGCYDVGHALA